METDSRITSRITPQISIFKCLFHSLSLFDVVGENFSALYFDDSPSRSHTSLHVKFVVAENDEMERKEPFNSTEHLALKPDSRN